MSDVAVTNTTSGLSGKSLLAADVDATVTGLHTFNRGSGSAPFAVGSGAASVSNLDADKVDGIEGTALLAKAGGTMTGAIVAAAGTVSAPGLAVSGATNGVYASGTNALDFATNGTKALGIDSTQFVDSPTQPRCSAYNSTTQSVNNATATALTFDTEDFDVGSLHDTGSNTSRLTVPTGADGLYLALGQVTYAANATGIRQTILRKNGSTNLAQNIVASNSAASVTQVHLSTMVVLAAGDYLEVVAVQNSGGALNTGSTSREGDNALQLVKLW